jgi:hypothetical protein
MDETAEGKPALGTADDLREAAGDDATGLGEAAGDGVADLGETDPDLDC